LRTLGHDLGFVPLVTGLCVIVYVASLLTTGGLASGGGLLGLLAPSSYSLLIFGASGVVPVFSYHRWWTVLSACWLHANLLHIAFNLLWIRQLAPAVGELYGAGRMVIIYVIAGVLGFVLSSLGGATLAFLPIPFLQPAAITVGASGAIMGLMGSLVYYGRRTGSSAVGSTAWSWAIPVFIFGLIMPGIDNYAHIGGFAGGYLAGMMLDPLKPERINHPVGRDLSRVVRAVGHRVGDRRVSVKVWGRERVGAALVAARRARFSERRTFRSARLAEPEGSALQSSVSNKFRGVIDAAVDG
jgi:rhomboid protease GluP